MIDNSYIKGDKNGKFFLSFLCTCFCEYIYNDHFDETKRFLIFKKHLSNFLKPTQKSRGAFYLHGETGLTNIFYKISVTNYQ